MQLNSSAEQLQIPQNILIICSLVYFSDYHLKILIIGNSGVGKSCMLMRYAENNFTNNFYNTIGVDFVKTKNFYPLNFFTKKIKSITLDNKIVKLQIWDTAGQDRFRTITCSYYRGAHGIMIVYDITDRESFENIKMWIGEIEKYASENVHKILIGNKSDMEDKRKVSFQEGEILGKQYYKPLPLITSILAKQFKIQFLETSAKTANNIDDSFQKIARQIIDEKSILGNSEQKKDRKELSAAVPLEQQQAQKSASSCC